jgi:hypothetical protein
LAQNERHLVQGGCTPFKIDFSEAADGTELNNGDYVRDEWLDYGMKVHAVGFNGGYTPDGKARIFDSTVKSKDDPDLNSPHRRCRPIAGNGFGKGGRPGRPGENCNPKGEGNLLIIQETNKDAPDDHVHGGRMTFTFDPPVTVLSVGLMDIETVEKAHFEIHKKANTSSASAPPIIQGIVGLGGNSIQEERINHDDVKSLVLVSKSSFGVRFVNYCRQEDQGTQSPTLSPTFIPSLSPTFAPTVSPTFTPPTSQPTISPTVKKVPPRINEILYLPNTDPFTSTPEERIPFVEVFRPDTSFNLDRCALVNGAGQSIGVWENQTNVDGTYVVTFIDDDFLDVNDGLALYCDSELVDYVAWCELGFGPSGAVYDEAVSLGIWSSSDCFYAIDLEEEEESTNKQRPVMPGDSIGRNANTTDTNSPTDWFGTGGMNATGTTIAAQNLAIFVFAGPFPPLNNSIPKAKWTVMTYSVLDHGGKLEGAQLRMRGQLKDFGMKENPDKDNKVHFVFQQDNYRAHFTNPTWDDDINNAAQDDGTTLSDFITWAKFFYPADHYLLHLEGHGYGW